MKCFAIVAESEFEVYLEVTDDNEHVDIWTYKSDKLGTVLKWTQAFQYSAGIIDMYLSYIELFV